MIVFTSRTGNVRHIVNSLKLPSLEINQDLVMSEPYLLFTYTDGLGDTPKQVVNFLQNETNQEYIKGVIVSGNVNFGSYFCKPADVISNNLNVPVIRRIDLRGTNEDVLAIQTEYKKLIVGDLI